MTQWLFLIIISISFNTSAETAIVQNPQSIQSSQLSGFANYPSKVQQIINLSLNLADQKLGYLYGSALPKNGGMDCSGTIYYILSTYGLKHVPRSSEALYQWVKTKGHFKSVQNYLLSSADFSHLKPGDLLFWTGTYKTSTNIYVSHVMLYLGTNKEGKPLMIGSSNGRTYQGKKVYGVSVFDFYMPDKQSKARFLGYSCIPEVSC